MAAIDIRRPHTKSLKAAKAAVEKVAKTIAKDYGIQHHWQGDTLVFDRTGVKGHIALTKEDLHVRVELGFLMGAMKGMIEREIERELDKQLA
jgi:putative polyhydroxyalkanoate system protein